MAQKEVSPTTLRIRLGNVVKNILVLIVVMVLLNLMKYVILMFSVIMLVLQLVKTSSRWVEG